MFQQNLFLFKKSSVEFSRNNLPNTIEDGAVREDPDVNIGNDNVVEMSLSLVGEEQIWHPNFVGIC